MKHLKFSNFLPIQNPSLYEIFTNIFESISDDQEKTKRI